MLKNNIEVDVKVKCIENGMTQAQLAEKIKPTKRASIVTFEGVLRPLRCRYGKKMGEKPVALR